jgi:hypothetical protein
MVQLEFLHRVLVEKSLEGTVLILIRFLVAIAEVKECLVLLAEKCL